MRNFYQKTMSILLCHSSLLFFTQIGMDTTTPRGALDINSPTTNNKGLVLPTNENPNNLINPMGGSVAIGTIMYDSTLSCVRVFKSSGWSNCLCDECNVGPIFTLTCDGPLAGIYKPGISSSGSKVINYTGGQGQPYGAINIASTGVTGLTATAPAGTLANGNGTIALSINGIPSGAGIANFTITLGGQTCNFQIQVTASGNNFAFKCGEAQFFGNTSIGGTSSGQLRIPYINGNGASYAGGQVFNSTGVTGLTATSHSAVLDNNNPLDFTINGIANQQGFAIFNITVLNSAPCIVRILVPTENH